MTEDLVKNFNCITEEQYRELAKQQGISKKDT